MRHKLAITSKDGSFYKSMFVLSDGEQEMLVPAANFSLSINGDGVPAFAPVIVFDMAIVDIIAQAFIEVRHEPDCFWNDQTREMILTIGKSGTVRIVNESGELWDTRIYAGTGELIDILSISVSVAEDCEWAFCKTGFVAHLTFYASSIESVIDGLDDKVFSVDHDETGASISIRLTPQENK